VTAATGLGIVDVADDVAGTDGPWHDPRDIPVHGLRADWGALGRRSNGHLFKKAFEENSQASLLTSIMTTLGAFALACESWALSHS